MSDDLAVRLVGALSEGQLTIALAESLTGGAVCSALVAVPGASACVRGGVVAYATDLKRALLGVDQDLLAVRGPVDPQVAAEMATGVRDRLGADVGLATTGVAGPGPDGAHPAGSVHVAASGRQGVLVRSLQLPGDRGAVRRATATAALGLALELLGAGPAGLAHTADEVPREHRAG